MNYNFRCRNGETASVLGSNYVKTLLYIIETSRNSGQEKGKQEED